MENPILYNATIRDGCLKPFGEHWQVPNGNEIRAALKEAGLTGGQFAHLVGVNPRTVRKWTGDQHEIPFAAWALLCHEAGFGVIWKL
jgi:DNA-binding transcriptional regulator YiaG